MNSTEIANLVTKALVLVLSSLATKYGIDGSTLTAIATGFGALVAAGISIYFNHNMKLVPETSVIVKKG